MNKTISVLAATNNVEHPSCVKIVAFVENSDNKLLQYATMSFSLGEMLESEILEQIRKFKDAILKMQ